MVYYSIEIKRKYESGILSKYMYKFCVSIQTDLDDFRHRKLTLQVRKLQTAADQKYFEIVGIKKIFSLTLLIYLYIS